MRAAPPPQPLRPSSRQDNLGSAPSAPSNLHGKAAAAQQHGSSAQSVVVEDAAPSAPQVIQSGSTADEGEGDACESAVACSIVPCAGGDDDSQQLILLLASRQLDERCSTDAPVVVMVEAAAEAEAGQEEGGSLEAQPVELLQGGSTTEVEDEEVMVPPAQVRRSGSCREHGRLTGPAMGCGHTVGRCLGSMCSRAPRTRRWTPCPSLVLLSPAAPLPHAQGGNEGELSCGRKRDFAETLA